MPMEPFDSINICTDITHVLANNKNNFWNKTTLSVKFLESNEANEKIQEIVLELGKTVSVYFTFTNKDEAVDLHFFLFIEQDIRISFQRGKGTWSYIGTDAEQIPKNMPTMNFSCLGSPTTDKVA